MTALERLVEFARTVWTVLFGRRERNASSDRREAVWTIATCLTALRALGAGTLFVVALVSHSHQLLLVALGVSMFFDFVDGFVARSSDAETVFGAQFDGLADRVAAAFVIAGVCSLRGDTATWVAAIVVGLQFGLLDQLLASQFLRFGLWSPDHFYVIDERVWRMNWSPLAKLSSNLPIALLAIGATTSWVAVGLAVILIAVRIPSYAAVRMQANKHVKELYLAASEAVRLAENEEAGTSSQLRHSSRGRTSSHAGSRQIPSASPNHRRRSKDQIDRPAAG